MQAAGVIALASALVFRWEEIARRIFLRASDAGAAPLLALPRASADLFDHSKLFLAGPGDIRCGKHAARASR